MNAPTATRPPDEKTEQYRCGSCAYGVSVARELPHRCPMCGGRNWQLEQHRRSRAAR
jgi:rubrerythrin